METVNYTGKEYPVRIITMKSKEAGEVTYTIATQALQQAFCNAAGSDEPANWDAEARAVDEGIYFFVDSEEILNLPGQEIAHRHLDTPFKYIAG